MPEELILTFFPPLLLQLSNAENFTQDSYAQKDWSAKIQVNQHLQERARKVGPSTLFTE